MQPNNNTPITPVLQNNTPAQAPDPAPAPAPATPPPQGLKPVIFKKEDIDKYGFKPVTPIRNKEQKLGSDIVIRTKQAAATAIVQGDGHGHG